MANLGLGRPICCGSGTFLTHSVLEVKNVPLSYIATGRVVNIAAEASIVPMEREKKKVIFFLRGMFLMGEHLRSILIVLRFCYMDYILLRGHLVLN